MTPGAKKQAAYRARQTERFERRGKALTEIINRLDGNDKSLAVELRKIATEALELNDVDQA